ncbi:MAG: IPT/TIG domain-containing protein [Bacteroidetes bacterium]|nr:IPT/TIG domain-containing protein [Bacteroidota bacterium]
MKHILNIIIIGINICMNVNAQTPTITSFTPISGSIGALVTIVGSNLNNLDTIKIGGVNAIKISDNSISLVAMVMPGSNTGTIYLSNSSGNTISSSNYTVKTSLPPTSQLGNKSVGSGNIGAAYQGRSICLSADGNTMIVGGYGDNSGQGAAWIYTRSGGVWSQQGNKLVGTGNIGAAQQGRSVSLSADGNTAIVGGYQDNSGQGAAWIYSRSGGAWSQQGNKLVGTSNSGIANQGWSVSLSADGNTAIVGGYQDNNYIGATWVYTRSGGAWSQQGNKLVGTGYIGTAQQGYSVNISADGNTMIVGGYGDNTNQGAAWIFVRSGGVWSQQGSKIVGTGNTGAAQQGNSVSISADGNTTIVGGFGDNSNQGAVWAYVRSGGGVWSQQGNKLVGIGSIGSNIYQGISISISADGNTAIVGGYRDNTNQGAAWIYVRSGGAWSQQGSKLVGAGSIGANVFQGFSVNLSPDGNTAIVGGYGDNSNQGAVWSFIQPPPTITSITPTTGSIGTLVTITGTNLNNIDTIKIGNVSAIKVSSNNTSLVVMVMPGAITGNIYIANSSWNIASNNSFTVTNNISPAAQQGSKLVVGTAYLNSISVSADGNTAIVGGNSDDNGQGAAWIYSLGLYPKRWSLEPAREQTSRDR